MPCSCQEARPMWIPRNTKLRQTRRPPRPIPGAMRWTNCCCRMPTTLRKPVLGICYGLQILNVYRHGTLLQHIESAVNHEAGRSVPIAHTVEVDTGTRLSRIVAAERLKRGMTAGLPSRSTRVIISRRRPSARDCALWRDVRRMESSRPSRARLQIILFWPCSGTRNVPWKMTRARAQSSGRWSKQPAVIM